MSRATSPVYNTCAADYAQRHIPRIHSWISYRCLEFIFIFHEYFIFFLVYHPDSLYATFVLHSLGHILHVDSCMGMGKYHAYRIILRWAQFNWSRGGYSVNRQSMRKWVYSMCWCMYPPYIIISVTLLLCIILVLIQDISGLLYMFCRVSHHQAHFWDGWVNHD